MIEIIVLSWVVCFLLSVVYFSHENGKLSAGDLFAYWIMAPFFGYAAAFGLFVKFCERADEIRIWRKR